MIIFVSSFAASLIVTCAVGMRAPAMLVIRPDKVPSATWAFS